MEQLNTQVAQYSVSYSIDGGKEWIAGPAECAQSPCTIRDLPAGTPALVKVNAWGQAGEGEPSEYVAAQVGARVRVWVRIRARIRVRIRVRVSVDSEYVAAQTNDSVHNPNPNPNPDGG